MTVLASLPRGLRIKLERALPESFWTWLHQLREVEQDRRWTAGRALLAAHPELAAPGNPLNRAECRAYSQNGEDGVLAWLFANVGPGRRRFVEFGIGNGTECNSANLALTFGWSGLQLEANPDGAKRAYEFYAAHFADVRIVEAWVTPENIDGLIRTHGFDGELDLLSVDIDGNDYWVWRAIESARARVVVAEYNASFGPERSVTIPYTPGFAQYEAHMSGWYHGASLAALAKLGAEKGYILVGCESRGINAFFVRADEAEGKLQALTPVEAYVPALDRSHVSVEEQFARIAHMPLVEV